MFDHIKGVGPKKELALNRLGLGREEDLFFLLPRTYRDMRRVYNIGQAPKDQACVFKLEILSKSKTYYNKGRAISRIKAKDQNPCEIIYFNDRFSPKKLNVGRTYLFYVKLSLNNGEFSLVNPEVLGGNEEKLGIEPVYPLTKGLYQKEMRNFVGQALDKLEIKDFLENHPLKGQDLRKSLKDIHRPESFEDINRAYDDLAYRKALLNILSLNYIRSKNIMSSSMDIDSEKLNKFIRALPFEPTKDQKKVLGQIAHDLRAEDKSLNRLIQGDVGSGKTLVAIGAIVMMSSYQSAFLAPTEILARQHYENYRGILNDLGFNSQLLVGASENKDQIKEGIKCGDIHIIFATHAILQDDVSFSNLSLVIVDEQHKFGVHQRNILAQKAKNPNLLHLSATPIPRTLAIAKYGDMDISSIKSKPEGRLEIETFAVNMDYEKRAFDFIEKEIAKRNKAYIVCPAISHNDEIDLKSVEAVYERFKEAKPGIRSAMLHGDMTAENKNSVIEGFSSVEIDLLISTTVVEVGVDVKKASIMMVYNAERFGLSQLHQLRGRVGRSDIQSYCILVCSSNSKSARMRMEAMCQSNDGFYLAEKDLEMRGPGQLLGKLQSGESNIFEDLGAREDILVRAYEDAKALIKVDPLYEKEENRKVLEEVKNALANTSLYSLN